MIVMLLIALGALLVGALWLVCVIYIYLDATRRNVSGAAYWAVGALFSGPLALVAYLIDRPAGALTECRFCTRQILESDAVCPYCGRERREE
jgi:hypothetical protein